ncbi:MAG: hypothetical protein WCJ02_07750 [bacterium]
MSTMVLPRRLLCAPTERQILEVLDCFIAETLPKESHVPDGSVHSLVKQEMRMVEMKFSVLMMVGRSAEERAEFCRENLKGRFEIISLAEFGVDATKERFVRCLQEKRSCALDGEFMSSACRGEYIESARRACAWVVAFDFCRVNVPANTRKMTREERQKLHRQWLEDCDRQPTLKEGFDEINRVRQVDGCLKFTLFEKRVPMQEFVKDEEGNRAEVELGPESYMIERPGCSGGLMSRAAFAKVNGIDLDDGQ